MALTNAQLQTLKASIQAETTPAFVAMLAANDESGMAAWYNEASPSVCWRTRVTQDEIMQNGFDWVQVDNLSVGKARIWEWMFANPTRSFDPSKANVRAGIDECWKGTSAMLAVRAAVYVHCKRIASRIENLYATGTKTEANPGTFAWEGQCTAQLISDALRA